MNARGIGATDKGRHRLRNEDAMLVDDEGGVYAVCDGLGGHPGGDVASTESIAAIAHHVRAQRRLIDRIRAGELDEDLLGAIAAGAATAASRAVRERARADPALLGMGCTLTLLVIGRERAAMAHVGDSRLYLLRGDRVTQLSTDHNVAHELAELGLLSAREARRIRAGHVLTRAIGLHGAVEVEQRLIELLPGDRFVLCSDGLSRYVSSAQRLGAILHGTGLHDAAAKLVRFANDAGGRDNITVVVVDLQDGAPESSS